MRKAFILVLVVLACVLCGCEKTYDGPEELMAKVREEIPVADADTIEIKYAGMSTRDNRALLWYVSGNDFQAHTYFVIECEVSESSEYKYIRSKDISQRIEDIAREEWMGGYSFCINDPKCKTLRITDNSGTKDVEVEAYPFVYYNNLLASEYVFLDENGEELQ